MPFSHKITSHLSPLYDSLYSFLQELEPNANLLEIKKEISQKWNDIEDLNTKKAII